MKKLLAYALVVAGIVTSASCSAALQYNYDQEHKVFAAISKEVLSLDDGANKLSVIFAKEYDMADQKAKADKSVIPTMKLCLKFEGATAYQFADNANYWQDHNYSYEEMGVLKEKEAKGETVDKPKKKLRRNPSTLIYLKTDVKESVVNKKEVFKFENTSVDRSALRNNKLNKQDKAVEKLSERFAAHEVEAKLVAAAANEARINKEAALRAAKAEQYKEIKEAYAKEIAEQKESAVKKEYSSYAEAILPKGDNFWKKVVDSLEMKRPMFLEVKFWRGGANQRIWLKTEKLEELAELMNYDLYKDEANLQRMQ